MAGLRVELLLVVVVTGFLLLVSVRGWERINQTQLVNFYESGQWGDARTSPGKEFRFPDDSSDYDNGEDAITDIGGAAIIDNFDPFADHGFKEEADSDPRNWASSIDGGFAVEFVDVPPRSWTSMTSPISPGLDVVCSEAGFQISLAAGSLSEAKVLGSMDLLSVMEAPESCGYDVNPLQSTFGVPFTGCNVKQDVDSYSLQLLYIDESGEIQISTASCDKSQNFNSGLFPRASSSNEPSKCSNPTAAPTTSPSKSLNCAVPTGEQVTCAPSGVPSSECEGLGCCKDPSTDACYYPLDECTADQHFVFAIRANCESVPSMRVDPTKLIIPGHPNCKPVIVNDKVAIFKFGVTECGARAFEVGETKIYLAEVQTTVKALNLKYGVITRYDPLRFMVECRYSKGPMGDPQLSLTSVGYLVKIPTSPLPPSVDSNGLYGVQLRIAKDNTYSSYFPTYHQPLRLLLGKPVYLELRLKSPKPDAVILVNYCVAYPRSAKNALVLIYEGCANPNDPSVSVLVVSNLPKNRYQRRFMVRAFQFMDQKTNKYLDEEIYFMCSAEVCRPNERTCEERCFDGKAP
ncbi:zona pellucida sperm-binding protein 4-like [Scomber scombrus]|uniref:Zona pellucida sperm-binding protein 4-like n=1 Tax=Scomber scombrus TaxID=13677 RepID=A0AAV1MRQ1_SCOSC